MLFAFFARFAVQPCDGCDGIRDLPQWRAPVATAPIPYNESVKIITTHLSADFDAFAAAVCAVRLYPGSKVVFPGSQELAVRRFLTEADLSYPELATELIAPFAEGVFSHAEIEEICHDAYDFEVPIAFVLMVGDVIDELPSDDPAYYDEHDGTALQLLDTLIDEFDMKTAAVSEVVEKMLGPTGNLRAPTLRVGKTTIVGRVLVAAVGGTAASVAVGCERLPSQAAPTAISTTAAVPTSQGTGFRRFDPCTGLGTGAAPNSGLSSSPESISSRSTCRS